MSISTEAAETRTSLSDERELVRTFEAMIVPEKKTQFTLNRVSTRREAGKLLGNAGADSVGLYQQFHPKC